VPKYLYNKNPIYLQQEINNKINIFLFECLQ
jgi:hypothetical protein